MYPATFGIEEKIGLKVDRRGFGIQVTMEIKWASPHVITTRTNKNFSVRDISLTNFDKHYSTLYLPFPSLIQSKVMKMLAVRLAEVGDRPVGTVMLQLFLQ